MIGDTGHGDYGHGIDTVWTAFEKMEVVAVADPKGPAGRAPLLGRMPKGATRIIGRCCALRNPIWSG